MEVSLNFHRLLPFALILAFSVLGESASDYGFTLELVHRDSPRSPYYNPADTPHQRMANAIRRSISRANRLDPSSAGAPKTPSMTLVPSDGEYLMNISLGTPPVYFLGIADTGSDLIWTQCKPCKDCFKQASPLFDPSKSKTYKEVSCHTSLCRVLDNNCLRRPGVCTYSSRYVDNSSTEGTLATETFTLGSTSGRPVSFPKLVFGCGHSSRFTYKIHADGIVGLGGGNASLVTQLGTATGGKFSYCLVPRSSNEKTSKLNFGANAVVAGRGTVSTRLIQKEEKTYYYLTLEAVSVGKTRVEYTSGNTSPSGEEGNIVIDSGTAQTYLPQDFYKKIKAAVVKQVKQVKQVKLTRWSCPPRSPGLCYRATTVDGLVIPTVTFHFKGADVELSPENTFVPVADGIIQFWLAPGNQSIYGNLAQTNYLIGYDIQNMKLSFKHVDCTLH
ncbi:aspartic proteinase CDR1 [Eucalyptus grandis]|uniref:aspartic proteinase CDR1 n=1 Tax=Eucalyptus grandis TaxID=71139 RepID=UPI00192F0669|nr:aspartic proteinase CDR1 [Eucalyptus grandis]